MMMLKIKCFLAFSPLLLFPVLLWGQAASTSFGMDGADRLQIRYAQMGTQWQILVYLSEQDATQERRLRREVKQLLDSLNAIYSDYDPQSELNIAAEKAQQAPVPVSLPLLEVMEQAQLISRLSDGAFDISIGPLSRLWRRAFRRQVFPERAAIKSAKRRVNYRWIAVDNGHLHLKREGMRLDLGGIAKGKTVDYIAELLRCSGAKAFLVDGGGDIRVQGHPPGKKAWQIELPSGQLKSLTTGAIATSGASYRYLEHQGKRYSHLIDPRTGYGVEDQRTVTVRAPTAAEADAWASVFSILGGKKAARLQRQLKNSISVYYFKK